MAFRNDIAKLIDPRGVCGDCDYIVNYLYNVNFSDVEIQYNILNLNKTKVKRYFNEKLSQYFWLRQIK